LSTANIRQAWLTAMMRPASSTTAVASGSESSTACDSQASADWTTSCDVLVT
jgi:hypothetical protein